MDWYALFKFLHVLSAVLWVGGGFMLLLAAEVRKARRGVEAAMPIVDATAMLGLPFFVPISLATLVFGAIATWFGPGFTELWVILGLAGFAATFLNGLLMIKPRADAMAAILESEGPDSPRLIPIAMELSVISRFDYVMLFLVIADMTLKPVTDSLVLLAVMAAVLAAGAALTLGRVGAVRQAA